MQTIHTGQHIALQAGDLLFQRAIDDDFAQAIVASTQTHAKTGFSHVGIVVFENAQCYVIEALAEGVCKTPLASFMQTSATVMAARLQTQYHSSITQSLERVQQQLGKPYDVYYNAQNDNAWYCSELVQKLYLHEGKPLFTPIRMSFKCKKTKQFLPYWQAHFQQLNCPIPEGELGSNPNHLAQSDPIAWIGNVT